MARYRKVDVRMWGDEKFQELTPSPPCGQTLWVYLLTGDETGIIPGLFRGGEAGMAEARGWPLEGFRKAFREVQAQGMAEADWKARLVWLPNSPKYNKPESPNVIRSWSVVWDELPECPLKLKAWRALKAFAEGWGEGFAKAFGEACRKPSGKAMANQEQEQEQEKHARAPARARDQDDGQDQEQTPETGDGERVDGAGAVGTSGALSPSPTTAPPSEPYREFMHALADRLEPGGMGRGWKLSAKAHEVEPARQRLNAVLAVLGQDAALEAAEAHGREKHAESNRFPRSMTFYLGRLEEIAADSQAPPEEVYQPPGVGEVWRDGRCVSRDGKAVAP